MYLFIVSGIIYVSGAIGFELLGGKEAEMLTQGEVNKIFSVKKNVAYYLYYTCEEFLEMFGIALFNYSLLLFISTKIKSFVINVQSSSN